MAPVVRGLGSANPSLLLLVVPMSISSTAASISSAPFLHIGQRGFTAYCPPALSRAPFHRQPLSCSRHLVGSVPSLVPLSSAPAWRNHYVGMSASSEPGEKKTKEEKRKYPPCRNAIDPATGSKWRLCAAAAVLDDSVAPPRILIGERVGLPGSWQCPQGGVDDADPDADTEARRTRGETLTEAAARELYEEMGLEVGRHVELVKELSGGAGRGGDDIGGASPVRYETTGTGSWLEKNGFAGQELRWAVFRCVSEELRRDPAGTCDLGGKNGERAEFTDVRWENVDSAVEKVWEKKRKPYESLRKHLQNEKVL